MCQEYIMWGAGSYGRRLVEMTAQESEHKIIAYCDKNMELVGKTLDGHKIISIETAVGMCRENSELGVIIGIFDYDVIAEVRQVIDTRFPQHTKVIVGHNIQDMVEDKMLQRYHDSMMRTGWAYIDGI